MLLQRGFVWGKRPKWSLCWALADKYFGFAQHVLLNPCHVLPMMSPLVHLINGTSRLQEVSDGCVSKLRFVKPTKVLPRSSLDDV